ncbi:MAG: TetR/AcrR family transcriptional regulator [Thermoflexales bacterium]|nr:TetR/AcrR family transcriptional regulator [Thermoflexales bacterium]
MTPRADVSTERRAQIIQAALACFVREGYNNTTMDDIVKESGLSKGSLYWYFKGKDELFEAALMSFFTTFGQEAFAALNQGGNASAKLRALGQQMTHFVTAAEGLFNLFLEFWASSARRQEAGQLWGGLLKEFEIAIVRIIEEGVRQGEFEPVDAEQLVWAVMAAYDGLAAYVMLVPNLDVARISHVFIETLLQGLEKSSV